MARSKTFNETETRELELFTINDGTLYERYAKPYIKTLAKTYKKGLYESEKAIIGWERIALKGAQKYAKDFCISQIEHRNIFTTADRREVAARLEAYYLDEVMEG